MNQSPENINPCLADLVRDWNHGRLDFRDIIIHKRADGHFIIFGTHIYGYIEGDKVVFGAVQGNQWPYEISAADPCFFDKLEVEFDAIQKGGLLRPVWDPWSKTWYWSGTSAC